MLKAGEGFQNQQETDTLWPMAKKSDIKANLAIPEDAKVITPRKRALIHAAYEFQCPDYDPHKTFIPREIVQATLPHRNPGDTPRYMRKNGNYCSSNPVGMPARINPLAIPTAAFQGC